MSYKKVYLKPGKEESLKRFHPWVFSGAIARVEGEPEEGEVVLLCVYCRLIRWKLMLSFGDKNYRWQKICAVHLA